MKFMTIILTTMLLAWFAVPATGQDSNDRKARGKEMETDIIKTETGELKITFIGHATIMLEYQSKVIHVDPVSQEGDYTKLPKADLVLITHEHSDHFDPNTIKLLSKDDTTVVLTSTCRKLLGKGTVMKTGDALDVKKLRVEAVPAYNIVHKRPDGQPFHPKGRGNGYVLSFGRTRLYIAGDTENIPEMKNLKKIDIAFLPMNLPYTMTPEMVADAAKAFKPKILYPYHYGQTDTSNLVKLLSNSGVEVRIRAMR